MEPGLYKSIIPRKPVHHVEQELLILLGSCAPEAEPRLLLRRSVDDPGQAQQTQENNDSSSMRLGGCMVHCR